MPMRTGRLVWGGGGVGSGGSEGIEADIGKKVAYLERSATFLGPPSTFYGEDELD